MIRGLYTAASGMLAMQRRQEALSNNLANINTPGYKEDAGVIRSFPEQLLARINDQNGPTVDGMPSMTGQPVPIGKLNTGVYMSEALPLFTQGDIAQTDSPYDVALTDNLPTDQVNGKAVKRTMFFSVARIPDTTQPAAADQIRYTRNGSWSIDDRGFMVTPDGYYVLDSENRAIQVNGITDANGNTVSAGQDLKITSTGELQMLVPNPEPNASDKYEPLGADPNNPVRLGLRVVTDPNQLVREGNNLYRWEGQNAPVDASTDPTLNGFYAIRQGWVERANVNPAQTMTEMMTALRSYEANQRVLSTLDSTLDKAVNEIGRVNG
ncbi:flagellar hook-basal body protein [Brevibacillus fluminis]|uniref:Flagellar hook-basal body protein n=1 Tax=Brevibacillus fluminis TaxID=511487 RepID=A0A3M8D1W0_9BACL|nr:flagellar hook-basal body protein [Brevibacillus fluminis]RNB82066.1 flagellar hook-basal body protein [Brevibacillus fluminis]